MGQALRRLAGRTPGSGLERTIQPPPSTERRPRIIKSEPRVPRSEGGVGATSAVPSPEEISRLKGENVLEERDPEYDAKLSQMLGRITTRPGGKTEMGEAFIVERYNRPLPKLRGTQKEGLDGQKPLPPGTLNTAQLRHILLLHQGKAEDHDGPMDTHQIAEKFKIDVIQVETILQFVSMPPEEIDKKEKADSRPERTKP